MKLLALDTSSAFCSLALWNDNKFLSIDKHLPLQQAQHVLFLLEDLRIQAQIEWQQLDALAFGRGPGSFTGVRIAASVIQGLGFALSLPIIPISSLAAIAQSVYEAQGWEKLLVCTDARMQEVYSGAYEVVDGLVQLKNTEQVCKPEQINIPHDTAWYGVGDGWEVYRNNINYHPLAIDFKCFSKASAIISLAKPLFERQEWVKPEAALPVYLRDQVATKSS